MSRYAHSLSEHLTQILTDTLSFEVDILVSTDDEVYSKITELSKLCAEKFYTEEHLSNGEDDTETEYHDMDKFMLGED